MNRISYFAILILCLSTFSVKAQNLEWDLNFHTFADNREYGKSERYSQTIFGARFAPEIGIQLDTMHRFRAGFNVLHEFGSSKFIGQSTPVLYYQFAIKNIDFYMGLFPRHNLLSDFPRGLLNDTLNYYRPNVEGMLFKYQNEKVRQTVWIDWTSRQTATDRETFLFGISGTYKPSAFFISHYAYMFHNAGPAIEIPGDHLQDNGAAVVQLGLDLSRRTALDSLTIAAGGMMSFERTRHVTGWETPKGALITIHAGHKRFGITNTFYSGEGHNLIYGDKFYTAKTYNRSDLSWTPILYKNIEGKFTLSFHFLEGVIDNQQAFGLRYKFGGKKDLGMRK
jgi:hypothetical protein